MVYAVMSEPVEAPKAQVGAESMSSLDRLASRISQQENQGNRNLGTFNMNADASSIIANADDYCCLGCDTGTSHDILNAFGSNGVVSDIYQSRTASESQHQNLEHAALHVSEAYVEDNSPDAAQKEINQYNIDKREESVQSDALFASLQDRIQNFNTNESYSNARMSAESVVLDADNYCCAGCDTGTGHDILNTFDSNGIVSDIYQSRTASEHVQPTESSVAYARQGLQSNASETGDSLDTFAVKYTSEISSQSEETNNVSTRSVQHNNLDQSVQQHISELAADTLQAVNGVQQSQSYDSTMASAFETAISAATLDHVAQLYVSSQATETGSVDVSFDTPKVAYEKNAVAEAVLDLESVTQFEIKQYQSKEQQAPTVEIGPATTSKSVYAQSEEKGSSETTTDSNSFSLDEVVSVLIDKSANDIGNSVFDASQEYKAVSSGVEGAPYRITASNYVSGKGVEAFAEAFSIEYNPQNVLQTEAEQALIQHESSVSAASVYTNKESGKNEEHTPHTFDDSDDDDEENEHNQSTEKQNRNKKSKEIEKSEEKKELRLKKIKKEQNTARKKSDNNLRKEMNNKQARRKAGEIKNEKQHRRNRGKSRDRNSTSRRKTISRKSNRNNSRQDRTSV